MINVDKLIKDTMKELVSNKKLGVDVSYIQCKLDTYKMIKTRIMEYKTAKNAVEYTDSVEVNMLRKMIKDRVETANIYKSNNRADLADKETEQANIIKELLPDEVSEDTIIKYINDTFDVITQKQMGLCIKQVKTQFPTADGSLIAKLVKQKIV